MNLRSTFSSFAVHSVFLSTNGKLFSWGPNDYSCLAQDKGSGDTLFDHPTEIVCPELYSDGGFTDFSAGVHHNLVLTNKSRLFVWGRNEDGQLGLGHAEHVEVPTLLSPFPDKKTPARVFCGAHFSVVLTEDGSVYTMGFNDKGQLGHEEASDVPKKVEIPEPVVHIACSWCSVLALTRSGQLYVWGDNRNNELQLQPLDTQNFPTRCPSDSLANLTHVQAGTTCVFAIQEGGTLLTWGESSTQGPLLLPLVPPQPCEDIACGSRFCLALGEDGSLFSCGGNFFGELGVGDRNFYESKITPMKVSLPENISRVAFFGCAAKNGFVLSEEGELYLWGKCYQKPGIEDTCWLVPTLLQNWKWELPNSFIWAKWTSIFQWLFLGRLDKNSSFNQLHVEIIFNFVQNANK